MGIRAATVGKLKKIIGLLVGGLPRWLVSYLAGYSVAKLGNLCVNKENRNVQCRQILLSLDGLN